MKTTLCMATALLSCSLLAGPAAAQTLKHPVSARPAALDYDYYITDQEEASPSDATASNVSDAVALGVGCGCEQPAGCDGSCDGGCSPSGCNCFLFGDGQAFALLPCGLAGFDVGLWSQFGYHTQGTNGFGTGLMNSYPDRLQLQQQWLYLEKKASTGGCGWDWGFRADYVYGTDGPDTQGFGGRPNDWDNNWNNGGAYGHAIPQLYAELAYNNLNVKMGHFYTIQGYEGVAATSNFFYSHAYTFYLGEPFTHSGALAEYAWSDDVTLFGGWTAGWDTGFTSNGGSTFLGGFDLQLTDNASFRYTTTMGDFGYDTVAGAAGSDSNGYSHTLLFTLDLGSRWQYVAQSDLVDNDVFLGNAQDLASFANYLFYDYNDCLGFGARLEWFKDPRIGLGASGEVTELTLGMNYKPHANVVLRPELRWDDFNQANRGGFRDSFLFGIDAILTY